VATIAVPVTRAAARSANDVLNLVGDATAREVMEIASMQGLPVR
jgi:hypothetical protein